MTVTTNLIALPPPNMPLITSDMRIEQSWYLCFQKIITQLGGFTAPPISVDDLTNLTDQITDIASVDALALTSRVTSLEALTADNDLQNVPSIQDVADALTLANVALESVDNAAVSGFANPTAQVGLIAVNGSATTAMRSDAAPALNVGISPTWTGNHVFAPTSGTTIMDAVAGSDALDLNSPAAQSVQLGFDINAVVKAFIGVAGAANQLAAGAVNGDLVIRSQGGNIVFSNNSGTSLDVTISPQGNVTIAAPSSGVPLTATGLASNYAAVFNANAAGQALELNGAAAGSAALTINTSATTGAQTATFTATNKPGTGTTGPTTWLPISISGTVFYFPGWR